MEKKPNEYSFRKGWDQVIRKDQDQVKGQLQIALGTLSKSSLYDRINGVVEPTHREVKVIEAIFEKHGITDIWDNDIEA